MADRILKADVRQAFASFRQTAERLGFNTRNWALTEHDLGEPWSLVSVDYVGTSRSLSSTEFPRYVGASNREAYDRLTSWSQAMHAVEILKQNGSN